MFNLQVPQWISEVDSLVIVSVLAMLTLGFLFWVAMPGRRRWLVGTGLGLAMATGAVLSFFEGHTVRSQPLKWVALVGTPLLVFALAKYCWRGYQAPWKFSWWAFWGLCLLHGGLIATLMFSVHEEYARVNWALFVGLLLFAPIFVFKGFLYWLVETIKNGYMGILLREPGSERGAAVYVFMWWQHRTRKTTVTGAQWLAVTSRYPQFIDSAWWQTLGKSFWPDVMEWNAKLGTANMLWFIQERINNPPQDLEDVSSSGALWA